MVNAQRVYELAMGLMDEVNEANAGTDAEYKSRALLILNVLRGELYPYSDTYEAGDGGRPVSQTITDFETGIELDDYICESVLPYGLAAHLMLDEDPNGAEFFRRRYDELKALLARGLAAESRDISDVYGLKGGLGAYDEFGRW